MQLNGPPAQVKDIMHGVLASMCVLGQINQTEKMLSTSFFSIKNKVQKCFSYVFFTRASTVGAWVWISAELRCSALQIPRRLGRLGFGAAADGTGQGHR